MATETFLKTVDRSFKDYLEKTIDKLNKMKLIDFSDPYKAFEVVDDFLDAYIRGSYDLENQYVAINSHINARSMRSSFSSDKAFYSKSIYFIIKFAQIISTKLTVSAATKARMTGIWNSGKLA